MTMKDKAILLKIHEQVKKLTVAPQTTFSPYSGAVTPPTIYQPSSLPAPLPPSPKYQG